MITRESTDPAKDPFRSGKQSSASFKYFNLGLSDYCDSTRHRDSLGLFTIVIVDCLTI